MTVKQLIEFLQSVDRPDIPVRVYAEYDGGYGLAGGDVTRCLDEISELSIWCEERIEPQKTQTI